MDVKRDFLLCGKDIKLRISGSKFLRTLNIPMQDEEVSSVYYT